MRSLPVWCTSTGSCPASPDGMSSSCSTGREPVSPERGRDSLCIEVDEAGYFVVKGVKRSINRRSAGKSIKERALHIHVRKVLLGSLRYWKYFSTSNAAKKITATIQMRKKALNAVDVPGCIISALNAVCNATARISPSAAAAIRFTGRYEAEKASANPIAEEATTWRSVEPRKRRLPVKILDAMLPVESGVSRKSIFSAAAKTKRYCNHIDDIIRSFVNGIPPEDKYCRHRIFKHFFDKRP